MISMTTPKMITSTQSLLHSVSTLTLTLKYSTLLAVNQMISEEIYF